MAAGLYIPDFEEVKKYSASLVDYFRKYPEI